MNLFLRIQLVVLLSAVVTTISAQEYPIENGTVITCDGLFYDDGGTAGAPYSTNSYTFTICPSVPGDVIQVDFFAFSLWQSPNPNNSDRLFIYDGPDTGANSLGSYTGTQLQGIQVTGTINNPSGCLTFVFQANPNGNLDGTFPGWEAGIICTTPCDPPIAESVISDPEPEAGTQTVGACIGEPVTFSDNGSYAQPGFDIEMYKWNFNDGTIDTTSGPVVTHVFDEPGEYIVTLTVIDDNGCSSLNLEPLQVLVSTLPIFNIEHDNEICLGESATLDGSAVQSQTWTSLPPQVVSGETFLADGAGFAYSTSLDFDFFDPGAVLESCDDFLGVFINIEHSYLGDLDIQIECPDGTVVPIMNYPNGGGATYLGEAVDDLVDLPGENVPGTGYTYTWAPGATNGNLSDQPPNIVDYENNAGFDVSNDIVPEGTYEADGDLCNLVGCPLNGSWTLTIVDNLGADNGYIFFWGIDFNPEYFPDVTTFTPIIGLDTDSTYWNGPNLEEITDNGNIVSFTPDDVGSYEFTFSAINNFGCVQDTTVTIEVTPGPEADAGDDVIICTDSLQLFGSVDGIPPPPPNCEYTLEMFDTFGDGWNGFTVTVIEDGVEIGTYTLNAGSEGTATIPVNHGSTIQINTVGGTFPGEVSYNLLNPAGDIVFSDGEGFNNPEIGENVWSGIVDCQPEAPDYVFEWTPATGLSNPNIQDPMVLVDETTIYTMTVYDVEHPLCATTDEVTVTFIPNLNPGNDTTVTVCYFDDEVFLNDLIGGNPTPDGTWTDETGSIVNPETFDPADVAGGSTVLFTYTVGQDDCEFSSELTIEVQTSAENPDCCITNAVAGEDYAICELTAQLSAEDPLGTGTWTSNQPGALFTNPNNPNTTVTVPQGGEYTFTFTDNNGVNCSASDEMTINFSPALSFSQLEIENPTCASACNGYVSYTVTGGITPLQYVWQGGEGNPDAPGSATNFCSGDHMLYVIDAIGCTDSVSFSMFDPPPPSVDALATQPTCFDTCDASISIQADDAVLFTFDGGASYIPDNTLDSLCAGSYYVGMIDVNGCENNTVVNIVNPDPVVANFEFEPKPASTLHPFVQFTNWSTPAPMDSVHWTFGMGVIMATSTEMNPEFEFPSDSAGIYAVELIATNENGCVDTLYQNILIEDELLLYIPNSFTPNDDGKNEVWKPKGNNVNPNTYHLQIFDRYGHLVFETRDFEQGWNGDINGGDYYGQNEVYVYKIEASSASSLEKKEYKGHITVIR